MRIYLHISCSIRIEPYHHCYLQSKAIKHAIQQHHRHPVRGILVSMNNQGYYSVTNESDGQLIFRAGPFTNGRPIVEFLAIVHGLAYLKQQHLHSSAYTNFKVAADWVKRKVCGSKIEKGGPSKALYPIL